MGFLEGVARRKLTDSMSHKQVERNAPAHTVYGISYNHNIDILIACSRLRDSRFS